jgi:4-amino-4-deoxy-L-arabinose transferase-like glycosyltransferase
MRALIRHQAWIVLAAGVVFFANLGGPRLWDDDETKNASCAREMLERGDWIVPSFNYEPRYDKPILLYWLMMGSYRAFGVNEFAARLPSALLTLGTALLTYHIGRRLFRPEVGLWSGLILATCAIFGVAARAATPDSTLIFCTTLALFAFVVGDAKLNEDSSTPANETMPAAAPRSAWSWAAVYAAMGLAMLAKGPVGVVVPTAAIGLFCLLRRGEFADSCGGCVGLSQRAKSPQEFFTLGGAIRHRARAAVRTLRRCVTNFPATLWSMRPVTLALVVSLVAVPWYIWVGLRTGGRWPLEFFWTHNVSRFLRPMDSHAGGFLFHGVTLLVGLFPWPLAVLAGSCEMLRRMRRGEAQSPACLLLTCWAASWIVLFSICQTKLPNYVLPAYPALAVVAGLWVADWIAEPRRVLAGRFVTVSWAMLALVGVAFVGAVSVMMPRAMPAAPHFAPLGLILVAGAAVGWWLQRRRRREFAAASLVITGIAFFVALLLVVARPISRLQNGPLTGAAIARLGIADSAPCAKFDLHLDGLGFYVDRPVEELFNSILVRNYFADHRDGVLVTNSLAWEQLRPLLPKDVVAVDRQAHFGRHDEVVVVARLPVDDAAAKFSTAERPNGDRQNSDPIRRR